MDLEAWVLVHKENRFTMRTWKFMGFLVRVVPEQPRVCTQLDITH